MELFPAIDLRNGKCVRLHQGDYGQETIYGDDPVAQALAFAEAGAGWIHVVDLDGAKAGQPMNAEALRAIVAAVGDVPVQRGGGIRSLEAVDEALITPSQCCSRLARAARAATRLRLISYILY